MLKECMGVARLGRGVCLGVAVALVAGRGGNVGPAPAAASAGNVGLAQQGQVASADSKAKQVYLPIPGFDKTSLDTAVDPCNDFYKFACGKFEANHPIPADQAGVDQFYELYNVNTQSLNGILDKAAAGGAG